MIVSGRESIKVGDAVLGKHADFSLAQLYLGQSDVICAAKAGKLYTWFI
jgi:hypothetical protein